MLRLAWTTVALLSMSLCLGAFYEDHEDLPSVIFDFVIVGGGTAGNVIANRLTENPQFSVLVLEGGGSDKGAMDAIVPYFCPEASPLTQYDWNYTTTPQTALHGRSIQYARGHVIGGSSSINYMAYTRGSSDDFDRYASVTGDDGWSWENLQTYIRKNENLTAPADNHDTDGQFDPDMHSTSGINSVSLSGFSQPTDARVMQTTKELAEFPFNSDMNSGNPLGLGWLQSTILGGKRSSSATSYLGPTFINRPNLHVLLNAQVTRVIQTGSADKVPAFRQVEYATSVTGPKCTVKARKEVILSAGSIGTPHILLNSGIGPKTALTAVGIKTLVDNPSVGANLTDHPLVGNSWFVNSNNTFETLNRNSTAMAAALLEWTTTQTGPLVDTILSQLAWLRIPQQSPILKTHADPSAGPNTPHYELIFSNGFIGPPPASGNFFSVVAVLVTPNARGSVTLQSGNPFDAPLINPNFLGTSFDVSALMEAVRSAKRFVTAPAWKDYIIKPFGGLVDTGTDIQLEAYVRNNTVSVFHPVGTCAMSANNAQFGVVNSDLLVKNVAGLRIVDASILPFIPAAHTQAPVYIIAERAADLIKAAH